MPSLTHSIVCALCTSRAKDHQAYSEDNTKPASLGEGLPCLRTWHRQQRPSSSLAGRQTSPGRAQHLAELAWRFTNSARLTAGKTPSLLLNPNPNRRRSGGQRAIVTDVTHPEEDQLLMVLLHRLFLDPVSPRKLSKGLAGGAGLLGGSCDHRPGSLPPQLGACRRQEATSRCTNQGARDGLGLQDCFGNRWL